MTLISYASDVAIGAATDGAPNAGSSPSPTGSPIAAPRNDANVIFNAFDALRSQAAVLGHDGTILVSNAAGAIGSDKGSIRIAIDQVEISDARTIADQHVTPGIFCRISVVDSGPGIPPDVIARLFDPFFTTKAVGEGTGLGLSVVHGIMREHHGFIEAGNEPDAGARFDVYFPGCQ